MYNDLSGLFEIKLDGNNLNNYDANDDIKYKVNSYINNIDGAFDSLVNERIDYGAYAARNVSSKLLSKDFVRHISQKVTGSYSVCGIISNEMEQVNDVSDEIFAAIASLESQWKAMDVSAFTHPDTDTNNILLQLAKLKFKNEHKKATDDASGSLKEHVDASGARHFPILYSLLRDVSDSSDVSGEFTFGIGESRVNASGITQTESIVFHIKINVTSGKLDDGRDVNTIMDGPRTYKVVLNID